MRRPSLRAARWGDSGAANRQGAIAAIDSGVAALAKAAQDQGGIAGRIVGRETGNHRLDGADLSAGERQLMAQNRCDKRLADPCSDRSNYQHRHKRSRPLFRQAEKNCVHFFQA